MRIKAKPITISEELKDLIEEMMENHLQTKISKRKVALLIGITYGFPLAWKVKRKGNKVVIDKVYRMRDITQSEREELRRIGDKVSEDVIVDLES